MLVIENLNKSFGALHAPRFRAHSARRARRIQPLGLATGAGRYGAHVPDHVRLADIFGSGKRRDSHTGEVRVQHEILRRGRRRRGVERKGHGDT